MQGWLIEEKEGENIPTLAVLSNFHQSLTKREGERESCLTTVVFTRVASTSDASRDANAGTQGTHACARTHDAGLVAWLHCCWWSTVVLDSLSSS